eukprot:gene13589-biopygen10850
MREIFTHKQGIKYYIVLEVEFHKPIGDIISDPPPVFRSAIYSLLRSEIEDIEELEDQIDDAIRKLKNDIDEFTENGSGWIFTKYIKLLVKMFNYEAIKGYDMHHILKNLNGRNAKIIANSKEKIMTAQIGGHSEENEEAWDAMLKMTGVTLELLSEEKKDIHLMIEDGIRGGVSIAVKRHAESTENNTLMYLDANNLYGWAMSQPMP